MSVVQEIGELSAAPRIQGAKLVCEVEAKFTRIIDFGIRLEDLLNGQATIPAAGARFDVAFAGAVHGPHLEGALSGTDYLTIRPDGRSILHMHGMVTTLHGERISFFNTGTGKAGVSPMDVLEHVELYSASPTYAWVNGLAAWGVLSIDAGAGEIRGSLYSF